MKKRFIRIIAAFLAVTFLPLAQIGEVRAAVIEERAITYDFDEATGTLTVTGEGILYEMTDWENEYCDSVKELVIGEGITEIYDYAFYGCKRLSKLTLPEGLEVIGSHAFSGCNVLKEIEIPSTVKSIGSGAFNGCNKVTKLELPEGLETIENYAFYYCNVLKEIEIPSTVKSIGRSAFSGCNKVTKLELPEGLEVIESQAFYECNVLKEIEIPSSVTSIGRSAFYGCNKVTKLVLPEGLETIEDSAFYNCNVLKEIEIPSSVKSIGSWAFLGCNKVTKLELPEGLEVIGVQAFEGCNALEEIKIPSSVKSIGSGAFLDCYKMTKLVLPEGLETIEDDTFQGCTALKELDIPSGVTSIGAYAFVGCNKVTKLELPEGLEVIGDGAFYNCNALKEIAIPSNVTSIGNNAFCGCISVTKLELPEGLETIEDRAFDGCNVLEEIKIPSTVKSIGSEAFFVCKKLTKLELPEGLKSIDAWAFGGSESLDKVILPSTLTEMGEGAFSNDTLLFCNNDYQIEYCRTNGYLYADVSNGLNVSDTNVSIAESAYYFTGEEICPEPIVEYDFGKGKIVPLKRGEDFTVSYSNNISCGTATVKITGQGIYKGEKTLEFEICKPINNWDIDLEYSTALYSGQEMKPTVTVKEGEIALVEGRDYEIQYANNIEEGTATVTITGKSQYKGTVTKKFTIYKKRIEDCSITQQYTEIVYDGTEKKPVVTIQDADGNLLKEAVDYQLAYENVINPGTATIKIQGLGVYKGEKTLTYTIQKISIDDAEVTLDETIFTYDGSVKQPQVVVKLGGKVLARNVDYSLSYLNNITVGTAQAVIRGIGNYTGEIHMSFTILPYGSGSDGVYDKDNTLISNNLIYTITDDENFEVEVAGVSKNNISKLVIPGTVNVDGRTYKVTSVGSRAFYKNTKIKSIVIGNNVASIEDYAFYGCKNVKQIKMGKSVEIIGASSFRKCTKLTKVILPKSIDELGKNAFYGCKKLKTITINANSVVDISDNAIKGISKKAVIKVPKKLVNKYKKKFKGKTGFKKTMKIKKK